MTRRRQNQAAILSSAATTEREDADLAVVVVAPPDDLHADAVEARLAKNGVSFARTSLNTWSSQTVEWSSDGRLFLEKKSGEVRSVGRTTAVWWRRPGWFDSPLLDVEELELARDESAVMLPGAFEAVDVRWVDQPWTTARARNRLVQLSVASRLGVRLPSTIVTNNADAAARFVRSGVAVAKAISTGTGLAPFVDAVEVGDLDLVANAPVLLQRMVQAEADWRIVTVASRCFGWRRARRSDSPVDWRASDPSGEAFRRMPVPPGLADSATAVQIGLRLSFSVQDWLQADEAWYFLEVNPQGQWLFLDGAESVVSDALALHLALGDV